jgi:hypothetical protein
VATCSADQYNTEEIAAFLSGANPNWPKGTLSEMLDMHLGYATTEVFSRLQEDWAADIQAYDEGHEHMLNFADLLADGIVKKLPAQFKRQVQAIGCTARADPVSAPRRTPGSLCVEQAIPQ